MIDECDEDGSGSINFLEFVSMMMKKQAGSISKDEMKQVKIVIILSVIHTSVIAIAFFLGIQSI